MDITTIKRKQGNIILELGHKVWGREHEFWNVIRRKNYYKELE